VRLALGIKTEPTKAVSSQQLLNRVRAAIGIEPAAQPAGQSWTATNGATGAFPASAPAGSARPPLAQPPAAVAPPPEVSIPNLVTREATLNAILDFSAALTLAGIAARVAEICGAAKVSVNDWQSSCQCSRQALDLQAPHLRVTA
jgi:hypothetical protein